MINARHSALEVEGRLAYRYTVYGSQVIDGRVRVPKVSEEPVEKLVLPLDRDTATSWAWLHFEDLGQAGVKNIVWLLTRPTGPLA